MGLLYTSHQDEPKYTYGLRISDSEKRLRYFVHLCQGKKLDEATGNPQPSYRLDGLKIMAEFPKIKGDEEQEQDNVERKQVLQWIQGSKLSCIRGDGCGE